jgi:hypothetical protein
MPVCIRTTLLFSLVAFGLVPGPVSAQFSGMLADGTRFQGVQLVGWPEGKDPPRLKETAPDNKGRDLGPVFDANKPVNWLFNESAGAPAGPRPCVELFGGDRLPGQVVGYRYGTEMPLERQGAHLLVKVDPDAIQSPHAVMRVRAQAVRKVIWQPRRSDRYTPATLYLLDDRAIPFRALRWTAEGVTLLLNEGGTRSVGFGDIAELHLPRRDPWRLYAENLAVLTPDASARLMRIETNRGLVLTCTMERTQPGPPNGLLQPAWCLEPIGFASRQLRWLRCFWPHEVPLSLIEPARAEQRSPLEGGRAWQADANVKYQPLRSGGKLYGGGFGMQSTSELEFELPTMVSGFRSLVGMDELAFRGGCGRARVHVNNSKDKPLWQSMVLVGSSEVVATELLTLQGPEQGQKRLILVAEAPTTDRPAEADPLNIRSFVDWLEPCVELDRDRLRTAVQALVPETVPAWHGWTVSTTGAGGYRVVPRWDVRDPAAPRFLSDVVLLGRSLLLSRRLEVGPNQNFLCLALTQEPGKPAGWVEVRIDGRPAGQLTVPELERGNSIRWLYPTASVVPLAKYRGKTVTIEVEHFRADEPAVVEWRSLELVPSRDLVTWTPVEVVETKASAAQTRLSREPEHTLFATLNGPQSKVPPTDTYTIVAETPLTEISAFRLELLTDPRLNNNGPGRSDGHVFLSEFKVTAAPRDKPEQAEAVTLTASGTDYYDNNAPSSAVDGKPDTGWLPTPLGRPHVIVFTAAQNVAFPSGARLTFTVEHHLDNRKEHAGRSPGRFRLSATGAARPVPMARPCIVLEPPGLKTIFEDEYDFVQQLNAGPGAAALETKDKYQGSAAIRITGSERLTWRSLGEIRIRREPGRGEFRYLQFAWKKSGGQGIGIQLAHDGKFGSERPMGPSYRYHAGTGKPWGADSLALNTELPADWVLVTRDLFTDFGEFTLTGICLTCHDGTHALFDHIRLGRTLQDLEPE